MPNSLDIQLKNDSNSDEIYCYITGIALQHGGKRVLIKADGRSLYFPASPSKIMQPLAEDCAIRLGKKGTTKTVTIPQLAGGRVMFSVGGKLTLLLNPGPALVEPSPLNPSDPNANIDWAFAELTLNNDQLFANISYVDFVPRLPVALTLQTTDNKVQHVSGTKPDGLNKICDGLRAQAKKDGRPWDKLIVFRNNNTNEPPLRALNPTHAGARGANFNGYYDNYVNDVWKKYAKGSGNELKINTQSAAAGGVLSGSVNDKGELVIGGEAFKKPNTQDIFSCNSGPFTTGPSLKRNAIIPRLAAGFIRSAILDARDQPSQPNSFYKKDPTNHYSRIVHEVNLDKKGYAFAYDDVQPDGGADHSGKVNAGNPKTFIITVGGNNAYAGDRMP
ncbi:glycoside hydrolase family 64 protein [Podospora australis]|uniref:Glycoside hydrolase family 64 protein n=1 Tax=Podospora australis TaxID=1536484 RepID=A0AAN6WKF3_9PEZI|nr:glycoside hydrolase family 64 protein [Podospora australis]